MAIEKVRAFFQEKNIADRIREFQVSSATVELAAQALGCAPARIAKTISFLVNGDCVLIVCAGDAKVDNTKFKEQFHCKATMLKSEQVVDFTGHAVGGVCPFAITSQRVTTYLDVSLQRFSTVFPAAGSANSTIELTCDELADYAASTGWIDICKAWQE